jgi:hypothetical protein
MIPKVPITVLGWVILPFAAIRSGGHAVAHWPSHVLLSVGSDESV